MAFLTKLVGGVRRLVSINGRRANSCSRARCCGCLCLQCTRATTICRDVQLNHVSTCSYSALTQITLSTAFMRYTGAVTDLYGVVSAELVAPITLRLNGDGEGDTSPRFTGTGQVRITTRLGVQVEAMCLSLYTFEVNGTTAAAGVLAQRVFHADVPPSPVVVRLSQPFPISPTQQTAQVSSMWLGGGYPGGVLDPHCLCTETGREDFGTPGTPPVGGAFYSVQLPSGSFQNYGSCGPVGTGNCAQWLGGFTLAISGIGPPCTPPPVLHPCCTSDGVCRDTTAAICTSIGGTYHPGESSCNKFLCPQPPTGACCATNGFGFQNCMEVTRAVCSANRGQYKGDNTRCATANCPTLGGCCLSTGQCVQVTERECTFVRRGRWKGSGSSCSPNPCVVPTGACCYRLGNGNVCALKEPLDCAALNGTYFGDNTACQFDLCEQPPPGTGGCCVLGVCFNGVTRAICSDKKGLYSGDGSICVEPCGRTVPPDRTPAGPGDSSAAFLILRGLL